MSAARIKLAMDLRRIDGDALFFTCCTMPCRSAFSGGVIPNFQKLLAIVQHFEEVTGLNQNFVLIRRILIDLKFHRYAEDQSCRSLPSKWCSHIIHEAL